MKRFIAFFFLTSLAVVSVQAAGRAQLICDGKPFKGWEGDTNKTWRIEEGAFVGGSLGETVPHNEFLCTRRSYTNFVLRVKFKLTGKDGFINGGVQFRSRRVPNHYEVSGYQADMGQGLWGFLYDESRRNKVLVKSDLDQVNKILQHDDWNDYEVRCEGKRIRLAINGIRPSITPSRTSRSSSSASSA